MDTGSYAVGVHAFENGAGSSVLPGNVTLRIFCAENGQEPVAVLGPAFIGVGEGRAVGDARGPPASSR